MADHPMPTGEIPISTQAVELGHALAGFAIALVLLSSPLFGARLYSRTRPVVNLGLDDWFACIAYVLATSDAIVAVSSVRTSLGKNPEFIPVAELAHIGQMALAGALIQPWSMAAVKTSVACQFLRLKRTTRWKAFLYAMIALQVGTAIFNTIMQATRFIPAGAQWQPDLALRIKAQVWSDHSFRIGLTVSSSSNILTDVVFSLLPVIFLWDIQRPLREKIIVGTLMGLGLVASSASIFKAVEIKSYGGTSDLLAQGERICISSILEEQLGLIAACVPCLRAWFQRVLTRFGVISTQGSHSAPLGHYAKPIGRPGGQHNSFRRGPDRAPFSALDDQSFEKHDTSPIHPTHKESAGSLSA